MASPITDPKHFASHINEKMLADFLQCQNPTILFIADDSNEKKQIKKKRVDEDTVNRFIETIQGLQDEKRKEELFTEMLDINKLSSERHTVNLEKEAVEKGIVFDVEDYHRCSCHDERALWWYIHHRDIFNYYYERSDTENLAGLRELILDEKNIVEKEKIIDEDKLKKLGEGIAKIYENTLRGKKFKVSHFLEKDCVLIRIYLENLPDNQLVFVDNNNTIGRTPSVRSLFSIIFVYSPVEKMLGVRTEKPTENVPKLAGLFCKIFLNCTYAETTERKYNVENKGSVEKLELTPEPMSDIERVYLKAVQYGMIGDFMKTIRLDVGGRQNYSGTEAMQDFIRKSKIIEGEWRPQRFEIKFVFKRLDGSGRKRQITANLTKRGVNLKTTKEDIAIRQFLKEKGFIS